MEGMLTHALRSTWLALRALNTTAAQPVMNKTATLFQASDMTTGTWANNIWSGSFYGYGQGYMKLAGACSTICDDVYKVGFPWIDICV